MDKYNQDSVHRRVDYVQYIYKNKVYPNHFEDFYFPIAVYDRDGIIAEANRKFCNLAKMTENEIRDKKANIFDCLNENDAELAEATHNAFDGKENVYKGKNRLIRAEADTPEDYLSSKYPNAIFFPIARDGDGVSLAGVLLDENKTDETEELNL